MDSNHLKSIKKVQLIKQINYEVSKLPDYDERLKFVDVSITDTETGELEFISNFNPDNPSELFLTVEYIEKITPIFLGKYDRLT